MAIIQPLKLPLSHKCKSGCNYIKQCHRTEIPILKLQIHKSKLFKIHILEKYKCCNIFENFPDPNSDSNSNDKYHLAPIQQVSPKPEKMLPCKT